jgi:DNA-binding PadR family transcriptional regulator
VARITRYLHRVRATGFWATSKMPRPEYLIWYISFGIFQLEYMTRTQHPTRPGPPEGPEQPAGTDLSPLALSILELLHERPMHPYELAATMRQRHHDEFIRLNFGSLYHTVDALDRNGWIVPTEREKEGNRPERTIYKLTDSGHEVLLRVVGGILAEPQREYHPFSAGLMFMHHLEAADAVEHLEHRSQALLARITKLSRILDELLAGHTRLTLIELEHKIALLEAERAWVMKIAKEIADGKLEWRAGMTAGHEGLRRSHGSSAH